jgi:hypothetical protein
MATSKKTAKKTARAPKDQAAKKRTLELDAKGVVDGIECCEAVKRIAVGRQMIEMALNLKELRPLREALAESLEEISDRYAVLDSKGRPIPYFIPNDVDSDPLDFERYDGPYEEGKQYAPGRIVYYADGFFEAEDTTDETPPGSTWSRIGAIGSGHFVTDYAAFRKEVQAIHAVKHRVELFTVPVALLNSKKATDKMGWLDIIDFGDDG